MSTCNQILRRQGKPYPRTCAVCGLGPCHEIAKSLNYSVSWHEGTLKMRPSETLDNSSVWVLKVGDRVVLTAVQRSPVMDAVSPEDRKLIGQAVSDFMSGRDKELERELVAAKKALSDIYYRTEGCADGTPDASAHDYMCNIISGLARPFVPISPSDDIATHEAATTQDG